MASQISHLYLSSLVRESPLETRGGGLKDGVEELALVSTEVEAELER